MNSISTCLLSVWLKQQKMGVNIFVDLGTDSIEIKQLITTDPLLGSDCSKLAIKALLILLRIRCSQYYNHNNLLLSDQITLKCKEIPSNLSHL